MCEEVELEVKKVVEVEQCYAVTRTVCTETVETVPNEVDIYTTYLPIYSVYHIYNIYKISTGVCLHLRAARHRDGGRDGVGGVRHPVRHADRDRV